MATKVAINGFGRIGRLVARAILERDDHDLDLVSIIPGMPCFAPRYRQAQ